MSKELMAWKISIPFLELNLFFLPHHIKEGQLSDLQPGSYKVFLGELLARQLNVRLGDKVTLLLPEATLSPAGVLPRIKRLEVAGTFAVGAELDSSLAIIHLADAAKLDRLPAEEILCVGELLEEREAGKAESVCENQTRLGLAGVSADALKKVTIAYEPVWAIGTGKTATPEDADAIHAFIRSIIADMYGKPAADAMVIQYGGSMKADNAQALLAKENIDGGLIGGAALKADTFKPIAMCK